MTAKKVLSFEQGADFYFAKYQRHLDRQQYAEALQALRTAVQKQPDNAEYAMDLARLYSEMDFYLESNYILLNIFPQYPAYQEECLYGMGCNFFGMQDIEKAKECFDKVLKFYPNGVYSADAADFFMYLEEEVEADSPLEKEDALLAEQGRGALDAGNAAKAMEIFRTLCEKYPDQMFLKNNLALAHYCAGEAERAIELSRQILLKDRHSPHALCNLLLFSQGIGDERTVEQYRPLLAKANCFEAEDDLKVALTYCELGEHDKAYPLFQRALEDIPYDYQALYFAAACANNLGHDQEAEKYLGEMAKLWPEDSVVQYYLQQIRLCRKEDRPLTMLYNCQVPEQEIQQRLVYLNRQFVLEDEELQQVWQTEPQFYSLIKWGIDAGGEVARRMIVSVLGRIGDVRAQELLRKWLLRRQESDEIKQQILFALHRCGAQQPYVAYWSGKMTEVHLGDVAAEVPDTYDKILELLIRLLGQLGQKSYLPNTIGLFSEFLKCFVRPPKLRHCGAWAAALAAITLLYYELPVTAEEVAEQLDVSIQSVTRAMRCIHNKLSEK